MKIILCACLVILFCYRCAAQAQELQQLQLDLEKLAQFKLILSQMKQGYTTLENGYNSIRDATKGNFDLHKGYLDGLLRVSPSVKQSPAIKKMYAVQRSVAILFQALFNQYATNGLFSAAELNDLKNKYDAYHQRISDGVDLLQIITRAGDLRMSDAERLDAIHTIDADVTSQVDYIQSVLKDYAKLRMLREQQRKDNAAFSHLSGIK
ncbi:MAG: TerB family tellurite resistance protein [Bacteroidota bacterium]